MSLYDPKNHSSINNWNVESLGSLPDEEDDLHEYKSSRISEQQLKKAIGIAASAFWNTGGGVLIAGVNDQGRPDGGIPKVVGRQSRRDWVDQVLHEVDPTGGYSINLIDGDTDLIDQDHAVLCLAFSESHLPPHMAPNRKYYLRAGAHSVPARHFLIESLHARRGMTVPQLQIKYRLKPGSPQSIQIGLVALNEAPALQVEFRLDPLPEMWSDSDNPFPLDVGLVDRDHPFFMDLVTWFQMEQRIGPNVSAQVNYRDVAGNSYSFEETVTPTGITPWKVGTPTDQKIEKALGKLHKQLKKLTKAM